MRASTFFTSFLVLVILFPTQAQAAKWWHWVFAPAVPDFERPYLEDGKKPHLSRYDERNWKVTEAWDYNRGGYSAFLQELYRADIIAGQSKQDDVPVLEVGDGFMRLSGAEKRRVADYIDYTYQITSSSENGTYLIEHECGTPVGVYTRYGLQLQ